jgi:hypothetical protein
MVVDEVVVLETYERVPANAASRLAACVAGRADTDQQTPTE